MAHSEVERTPRRRGFTLTQQIFIGLALGILAGWLVQRFHPEWAIYFRPFNFKTDDPARVLRAVQYISHPANPWQKLRAEHPGQYEKPVKPVPDPNAWFHARVVVASPTVSVFVGDAKEPCLTINQLSDRKKGLVGIWVGNTSGGDFANFKIVPA